MSAIHFYGNSRQMLLWWDPFKWAFNLAVIVVCYKTATGLLQQTSRVRICLVITTLFNFPVATTTVYIQNSGMEALCTMSKPQLQAWAEVLQLQHVKIFSCPYNNNTFWIASLWLRLRMHAVVCTHCSFKCNFKNCCIRMRQTCLVVAPKCLQVSKENESNFF